MKTILYRAEDRGKASYGWLEARYSFSFANYFNPDKIGFGMLRVLNDDIIEPSGGFGTHPHNNMEIISIVLEGELEHKDSMGSGSVIQSDEVQVMSAGTGITHSEFNPSDTNKLNLLQLWIFPKEKNIEPRYDQKKFPRNDRMNKLTTIVSGYNEEGALYIHQNGRIKLGVFDKAEKIEYPLQNKNNGVYLFVIDGHLKIDGEELFRRDAIGISETDKFEFEVLENSEFVMIEVPIN